MPNCGTTLGSPTGSTARDPFVVLRRFTMVEPCSLAKGKPKLSKPRVEVVPEYSYMAMCMCIYIYIYTEIYTVIESDLLGCLEWTCLAFLSWAQKLINGKLLTSDFTGYSISKPPRSLDVLANTQEPTYPTDPSQHLSHVDFRNRCINREKLLSRWVPQAFFEAGLWLWFCLTFGRIKWQTMSLVSILKICFRIST